LTSSPPTSPPSPANNSTNPSPPPTAPTYTQIFDQLSKEWPNLKERLMAPEQPAPATLPIATEPNPLDGDE
jgi:hypothetical protein